MLFPLQLTLSNFICPFCQIRAANRLSAATRNFEMFQVELIKSVNRGWNASRGIRGGSHSRVQINAESAAQPRKIWEHTLTGRGARHQDYFLIFP